MRSAGGAAPARALRAGVLAAAALLAGTAAGAEPYGFDDIALGASYVRLAAALDFRDVHQAIAAQRGAGSARPDFGRRGYACAPREDAYADVACVSHDERVDGMETREIRLHFLAGMLQQFSITAEIRHHETMMQALRRRHGPPHQEDAAGGYPASRWRTAESTITAYGGKDLVFVSYELASYPEWVRRRQAGGKALECR